MGRGRVFVSDELIEEFRGWLEFAGPDYIPGVPHCPSWPKEFKIQELGLVYATHGVPQEPRLWAFDVESDQFPWPGTKDWCPIFHKHDDIGPTIEDYAGAGTWCREPWRSCLPVPMPAFPVDSSSPAAPARGIELEQLDRDARP